MFTDVKQIKIEVVINDSTIPFITLNTSIDKYLYINISDYY